MQNWVVCAAKRRPEIVGSAMASLATVGTLLVGSICSGWGIAEMVIEAFNSYMTSEKTAGGDNAAEVTGKRCSILGFHFRVESLNFVILCSTSFCSR